MMVHAPSVGSPEMLVLEGAAEMLQGGQERFRKKERAPGAP